MFACRMSVLRTLVLLAIGATVVLAQRRLALPDPRSCANREYWFSLCRSRSVTIEIIQYEFL